MTLYVGLKALHLLGLATFLFAHGVSGGTAFALRGPISAATRRWLRLSMVATMVADPALLVVIVTGVWMAFLGSWWGRGWIWAAIVVLVALIAAMFIVVARPYYAARDSAGKSDQELAQALAPARPVAAVWIGSVGLVILVGLMVLKPF